MNATSATSASNMPVEPAAVLVRGRLAEAGAVLSGCLYFLAFAGFDQWWLTFVVLVPLYLAMHGQPPKRAAWLGFLCGLSMNIGGFYWLNEMLKTFSGFPGPLCMLFVVIICAYQGGRLALMGWLVGRATERRWPMAPVFAAAFAASELVYPLLFPWYYAATVHQIPVLIQVAEIGGPILVGLVLVSVNLAIAEPLRARLAASRAVAEKASVYRGTVATSVANEEKLAIVMSPRVIGAGVLALVATLLWGAVRIGMTKSRMAAAPSAKVGVVQGNMALIAKREKPGEGLRRHTTMTEELRRKGDDFAVWSESSVTFAVPEDLAMKTPFYRDRFAARLGLPTIFGAVIFRADPDRERWFNVAIATNAKGEVTGRYDKQFLLAFGEYLPFGDTFPILYKWSPHSGRFSSGTSIEPVTLDLGAKGKHAVSVLICYEDILPGFTNRAASHANPELLVNITNDAWFGDTTEPWEHLALAQFRAVEHRRYLVRSTNSGVSAIVDPIGEVVVHGDTFKAQAIDGEIHWLQGGTIYEVLGDVPWYLVALGTAFMAFRKRRENAQESRGDQKG